MCVTKNARHSRARARHQRASRASSPISVPPGHARVAAAAALARRSIARTRCGVGDGGGDSGRLHRASRASRALRVTRADAHVITMRSARHCRFLSPPCTTGTRALRWRRRLLDRAHTVRRWHWRWRWRSVTPHLTSVMRVIHTHTHARTCHRRFPSPPRTTGTRALRWRRRSLDREHAVWRWRWRWRSVTPRATHAARLTRAHTRHQSASRKERARLNRRTKQLEFDLDIARRDAAAARADEAAARADGAADRAKIASLRILKVTLPLARTHARTRARRGVPPPGPFRGDLALPLAHARRRSLACSLSRMRGCGAHGDGGGGGGGGGGD